MSDDQQMTSSIETHIDPSTSATTDLQVKISKNTRLFTSNAKKWKKQQQQQQPNQRSDVNSSKIKTKAKAKAKAKATATAKTTTHTGSATNNTVVSEAVTATATAITSNQERNTGSVVITIRLLKMETTRGFEVNSVGNELTQIDNYSNNNNNSSSNSSSNNSNDRKNNNNNTNDDRNRLTNQFQAEDGANVAHSLHCNVYMPENSAPNQKNSFKMDNNNVNVRRIETDVLTVSNGGRMAHNNANNGQNSVKKSSHVNRALRSEAIICDNVPRNCTSQAEQPHHQQQMQQSVTVAATVPMPRNCLTHSFNEMRLAESMAVTPSQPPTAVAATASATTAATKSIQSTTTTKTTSAFIPSSLIGTVSPYPHHIPIANIIRSDCFNGLVDTERKHFCF